MTKEQALSKLNELWLTYKFKRLIAFNTFTNESNFHSYKSYYYGYKDALIELEIITTNDTLLIENQQLVIEEK